MSIYIRPCFINRYRLADSTEEFNRQHQVLLNYLSWLNPKNTFEGHFYFLGCFTDILAPIPTLANP